MAICLTLLAVTATLIPYLVAARLVDGGHVFAGMLLNPVDGFSYLAKMRQGAEGSWTFRLPYAMDPGSGSWLFLYHLLLGHMAAWLKAPLITVYHAARLAGAFLMWSVAYMFFRRTLPSKRTQWVAFLITLAGSGLGWLAAVGGRASADLVIPEAIPFVSAFANSHFPLATAAILGSGLLMFVDFRPAWLRGALSLLSAFVLGAVQPFSVVGLLGVFGAWLVWEAVMAGRTPSRVTFIRAKLSPVLGFLAGGGIWLAYDFWLLRTHPVLASWTAQNRTPSPPLIDYVFGYGIVLVLVLVAVLATQPFRSPEGRLLLTWALVNGLLLYAPLSFQRRLTLGLFFPLAGLAALGLERIVRDGFRLRAGLAAVLLVSMPSNLMVVLAGLTAVSRQDPMLVLAKEEVQAFEWLAVNAPAGAVVLASPTTGNRLPAFADVRVLYGHPFETPNADGARAMVEALYTRDRSSDEAAEILADLGVGLVFLGPQERALGTPAWMTHLPAALRLDDVTIYRVPER